MEEAAKMLEAKFQMAESSLNYLSRNLELRCQNNADGDNRINPVELLRKVSDIKKEYNSLVQEAAEIQKAQTEAMDYFRTQLPLAMQLLQELQLRIGSNGTTENKDKILELQDLLGVQFFPPSQIEASSTASKPATPSLHQSEQVQHKTSEFEHLTPHSQTSNPAMSHQAAFDPVSTRAALRASSTDFVEVSQEEFESISELVRCRAKLSEVNATYRILWKYFKEDHNTKPLLPADMHKMGPRVSGATGKAKLKILRALKILTLSSKEEVVLL